MGKSVFGIPEKYCEVCGKLIIPTPQWAYKRFDTKHNKTEYFCSWSCYRGNIFGKKSNRKRK